MENEHFLNFKKASKIKFHLNVGPFLVNNKYALPIIEGLLQDMNFVKSTKINYGPHHTILKTRQKNKNKTFDHQDIEELAQRANLMEYQPKVESLENLQENPFAIMKSTTMIIPIPSKVDITGKRSFS